MNFQVAVVDVGLAGEQPFELQLRGALLERGERVVGIDNMKLG